MVKGANIIGYKVYVEDAAYLIYEGVWGEAKAIEAADLFAKRGRKTRVKAIMEVEVYNSGQT
jgi:hypothetical protein